MYKLTTENTIVRLADNAFIPKDMGNRHYREYLEWIAAGNVPQPAFTLAEEFEITKQTLISAIQDHLDKTAQLRGYDSILSACSYAAIANAYQQEGIRFLVWRADCWNTGYAILNDVTNGIRSIPTSDQLISELPIYSDV